MPIKKPGRVLLKHVPLKFVRSKVSGGGRKASDAPIALVPFIDFLITLVVFLLNAFSSSGELLAQQPNLKMPDAQHTTLLEISPIIAINPEVVTIEGRRIADTPGLANDAQVTRIEPLIEDLETQKQNWSILHPQDPFPGTVIIQADRKVDFRVVKKIMFSAGQAGYSNVSFAVNKKGD